MANSLRTAFRRVYWVGQVPEIPPDRPVVLFANHHHFYDGHLLWYLISRVHDRKAMTWMEEWDDFPFFGPLGALPFPADDARRRMQTVRRTGAAMQTDPRTTLIYFPEARLHAPDEGVDTFPPEAMPRLHRVLPDPLWWPVAIHVTWHGESLPTVLMGGPDPYERPDGREHERLEQAWNDLRGTPPDQTRLLLEGRTGPNETWSFRFTRRLFERFS